MPFDSEQTSTNVVTATKFRPPPSRPELPTVRLPWPLIFIIPLLLLSIWSVWYVLSARSVSIKVDPDIASVIVDEWLAPHVGGHWLLRPGQRRVRVEAPGYTPFTGAIAVGEAQLQTHEITLDPLPGHLRVSLAPVDVAVILIDGADRGRVPGMVKDIRAGAREIEIRAPRYLPFYANLDIDGRDIEQSLDVTLEPGWADVSVDSTPATASIKVDGEVVGETPTTIEVLAGRRLLRIEKADHNPWQQTLKIVAGQAVNLGEIALAKTDGHLDLNSTPAAANVTVNGEFQGRTPLKLTLAPDRKHTIRLIKEGFEPSEQMVEVDSGETAELSLELAPELATVTLVTLPTDAELLINGEPRGSANQTFDLPTHEHEIIIRKVGYATYRTSITPRKGVEKRFKIRLKTADEMAQEASARTASKKGFVTTFGGHEMKLFTGGEIRMGTSRRELGRRANEVQRDTVLKRPFYLALKEVTNEQFRQFLATHESEAFNGNNLNSDEQPAVRLGWEQAALYCNWLSRQDGLPPFYQIKYGEVLGVNPDATGYRLPTEAEWEWASRVPPKGASTTFPWGNKFPPRGRSGNYADKAAADIIGGTLADYDDGFAVAAPVGSFSANLRGLYDMGGNVAEWVHDYYDAAPSTTAALDPLGPPTGAQHVIKGSSWADGTITELRLAFRDFGADPRDDVGFRLARYAQ